MTKQQFIYYALIFLLIVLSGVTLFVWSRVLKARKKTREQRNAEIAKIKHENELRRDFAVLTRELIDSCGDDRRLFEGVAANVRVSIEKEKDLNSAFFALAREKRLVYALSYVFEDGSEKLSAFFRLNGKPLTPEALEAVSKVYGGAVYDAFKEEYDTFDAENEKVSFSDALLEKSDEKFATALKALEAPYAPAAAFVKDNLDVFLS